MSGHSKWSQIKRQKGVSDVKRGQVFTKLANAISVCVKESGGNGDPEQNFKLRLLMEKAKEVNMPKENINRAIDKGRSIYGGSDQLLEVVYEGFGPGGTAVIVEAVTDNKMRTMAEVKNVIEKNGGTLANTGAVSYQFQLRGCIVISKEKKTVDEIFLQAADLGADEIEETDEEVIVYTKPEDLKEVKDALSAGFTVSNAELVRKPRTTITISDAQIQEKIIRFMDALEGLDHVQKVYSNFDIS